MQMIHGSHWYNFEEFSHRDSYKIESMCAIFFRINLSCSIEQISKLFLLDSQGRERHFYCDQNYSFNFFYRYESINE